MLALLSNLMFYNCDNSWFLKGCQILIVLLFNLHWVSFRQLFRHVSSFDETCENHVTASTALSRCPSRHPLQLISHRYWLRHTHKNKLSVLLPARQWELKLGLENDLWGDRQAFEQVEGDMLYFSAALCFMIQPTIVSYSSFLKKWSLIQRWKTIESNLSWI